MKKHVEQNQLVLKRKVLHYDAKCIFCESAMTSANRITVNLSADEYAALSSLSKKYQVSLAWLGRRAITDLIEKSKSKSAPLDMPFIAEAKRKS